MTRHTPAVLVAIGLALVVWRPDWVSVATLALLVAVALVLRSEGVAEAGALGRIGARVLELETRLAAVSDLDARTAKRLAEAEQRIQQAHERLQGMAAPRRGAGL